MTAYLLRRLLLLPLILWAVSFVVFMLSRSTGDPVDAILGEKAPKAQKERLRRERGFDRPILVQYGIYLGKLVRGDLGESFKRANTKVSDEIRANLPPTVELTLAAMSLAIVLGLALGVFAAVTKGGWIDYLSMAVALAGTSIPIFWLGFLLILALGGILPISGTHGPEHFLEPLTGFLLLDTLLRGNLRMFWDVVLHLAMPAMALSTIPLAMTARITRSSMLEVLGSDYVRTARAKGATPWTVVMKHALRNALIPIVTIVGLEFGYLLGGAVLTETVFARQGMGTYIMRSVREVERDSVGGAVLVLAFTFVLVNLAVDVAYAFIDPRVRYGPKEA